MTKAVRKPDAIAPATADQAGGTRQRALAAALDLFDAQGVDATTIEQLRDAAGISIGSLYHHFGSREGLVAALYDDLLMRYRAVIAADFARHDTARALLDSFVTVHISWSMQNPAAARFLAEHRRHRAVSAGDEKLNQGTGDFLRPLFGRLKPAITAGILKPLPPELMLSMVLGPIQTWLRMQRAGSTKVKWGPAAKLLADLIWDAIAVPTTKKETEMTDVILAANHPVVLKQWQGMGRLPFGRRIFNWLIGFTVPYAGSISPEVETLSPGLARARMADRHRLRNHLRSLHAVALTNLAEMTGNLALMSRQPAKDARWIITGFDSEYLKKARGTITAQCEVADLDWSQSQSLEGRVELRDATGDLVMIARPRWKIGPA